MSSTCNKFEHTLNIHNKTLLHDLLGHWYFAAVRTFVDAVGVIQRARDRRHVTRVPHAAGTERAEAGERARYLDACAESVHQRPSLQTYTHRLRSIAEHIYVYTYMQLPCFTTREIFICH